jgi:hypothetical protein
VVLGQRAALNQSRFSLADIDGGDNFFSILSILGYVGKISLVFWRKCDFWIGEKI